MQVEQFYKLLKRPDLLNNDTLQPLREYTEKYPWFSLGWMLYLKNLKLVNSPDFNFVLREVAIRIPDRKKLYDFINSKNKTQSVDFQDNKNVVNYHFENEKAELKGDSLIDKFLLSEPGKIRHKNNNEKVDETSDLNNIAENSVSDNEEFITETLANIYLGQKKYEKALDSFKKLSLKYPEKSIYFASRIEEIEKIIKK